MKALSPVIWATMVALVFGDTFEKSIRSAMSNTLLSLQNIMLTNTVNKP